MSLSRRRLLTGAGASGLLAGCGVIHDPNPNLPQNRGNVPTFGGDTEQPPAPQRQFDVIDQQNGVAFNVYPAIYGPNAQPLVIVGRTNQNQNVMLSNDDPGLGNYVDGIFQQYARQHTPVVGGQPGGFGGFGGNNPMTTVFGQPNVKANDLGDGMGVALVTRPDRVTRVDYSGTNMAVTTTFYDHNNRRPVIIGVEMEKDTSGYYSYDFVRIVNQLAQSIDESMPDYRHLTPHQKGELAKTILVRAMLPDVANANRMYANVNRTNPYGNLTTLVERIPPASQILPLEAFFGRGIVPATTGPIPTSQQGLRRGNFFRNWRGNYAPSQQMTPYRGMPGQGYDPRFQQPGYDPRFPQGYDPRYQGPAQPGMRGYPPGYRGPSYP